MANLTCASTLKLCALRAIKLDTDGTPLVGSNSQIVTDAPILLGYTPNQPDRERFEQLNGCGDQCALFIGDPKAVDSVDLRLNLCTLDAELIEFLAGGALITESYDETGYLSPTDATVNVNGVSIEAWSYAWAGRARHQKGGVDAYWRTFFPQTKWSVGEITKENGISVIPLTGIAEENSGWATGLAADPVPTAVGESVYGYFLDDAIPTAQCGSQAVA